MLSARLHFVTPRRERSMTDIMEIYVLELGRAPRKTRTKKESCGGCAFSSKEPEGVGRDGKAE